MGLGQKGWSAEGGQGGSLSHTSQKPNKQAKLQKKISNIFIPKYFAPFVRTPSQVDYCRKILDQINFGSLCPTGLPPPQCMVVEGIKVAEPGNWVNGIFSTPLLLNIIVKRDDETTLSLVSILQVWQCKMRATLR